MSEGSVDYHEVMERSSLSDNRPRKWSICKGEWACEVALWAQSIQQVGMFEAETFRKIARVHPESRGFLKRYAQVFIERFNTAGNDPESFDILFNGVWLVTALVDM